MTSTTALTAQLLRDIGYTPTITVLSVPVTFASIKNKDIDVFLGNWMPAQVADRAPYDADGSVVVIRPNLEGAKYTLAVPAYTQAQGLKDFNDIHRFAAQLNNSIYGIEPGNDGNRLVLKMIKDNQFGLGDFKLVESSEQGELAQVERAVRNKEPIVFLAWEPHPMNMRFDLKYLTGGDAVFGPNFGGATIYTVTRKGYSARMPEHGPAARESLVHPAGRERDDGRHPGSARAARGRRRAMAQVARRHGEERGSRECAPSTAARPMAPWRMHPRARAGGLEQWIVSHKIPVGDAMTVAIDTIKAHGTLVFDGISIAIKGTVDGVTALLRALPSLAAHRRRRRAGLGAAALLVARRVRRARPGLHPEPGLLGGDARDPGAGAGGHRASPRSSGCLWGSPPRTGRGCSPPCVRCSI